MAQHRRASQPNIYKPLPRNPARTTVSGDSRSKSLKLPWRPLYLYRCVLIVFIAAFLVSIICIETLASISKTGPGLGTSKTGLHYIWTYGPSIVTTLVALVWARVDYQAKLVAPWMHMSKGPADAERTLLLDYVSMLPIVVPFKAVRNHDYLVAATTMITFIFGILTVISTSLITLSPAEITDPNTPITVQDTFLDDPAGLSSLGSLPYYILHGLNDGRMEFPSGSSETFAYQTIKASRPDAEIRATLDGLSGSLYCQPATLDSVTWYETEEPGLTYLYMNLTFATRTCVMSVTNSYAPLAPDQLPSMNHTYVSRFLLGSCEGSFLDDRKIIAVLFGLLETGNNPAPINGATEGRPVIMRDSSQLICTPTLSISRVDLVKNGTQVQSVTLSDKGSLRTLGYVHAWDIASALFDSYTNMLSGPYSQARETVSISGEIINSDSQTHMALRDPTARPETASALLNSDYLESYMRRYYQKSAALIAHLSLMKQDPTFSTGIAVFIENRLLVRILAAHLMVGLLALAIVLTVGACIMAPSEGLLPRSPNTLLGQATLIAHNRRILKKLRKLGGASSGGVAAAMSDSTYKTGFTSANGRPSPQKAFTVLDEQRQHHLSDLKPGNKAVREVYPPSLHPAFRATMFILVASIIATLEVLLRISNANAGLGNSADDTYLHYLWTTLPATILTLVALYFASVDFAIRSLVPFGLMKIGAPFKGAPFEKSINLDLLDRSLPSALNKELRTGAHAGSLATTTLLVSRLLTIFTGSLFFADSVATSSPSQLLTETSFTSDRSVANSLGNKTVGGFDASLVLVSNLSYPAFTYEDLAMPGLALPSNFAVGNETGTSNSSLLIFNATVPAIRPKLTCQLFNSSQITSRFIPSPNHTSPFGEKIMTFTIDGDPCRSTGNLSSNSSHVAAFDPPNVNMVLGTDGLPPLTKRGYFAKARWLSLVASCSQWSYAWGYFDEEAQPNITSVSAMVCNETLEAVDVAVSFLGTSLDIDPANPPRPIEGSARPTSASIELPAHEDDEIYDWLVNTTFRDHRLVDPFFAALTSSRYAQPLSALGDPAQAHSVAEAIQFQHRVLRAVGLSLTYRVPANSTNATRGADPPAGGGADDRVYAATVTDPRGRRRVFQDAASTRVLQGLLAAMLALSVASWVLMPDTALLPRSPGSIADGMALLAGGGFFDILPRNAEWLSDKKLESHFRDMGVSGFCMGWGELENGKECLMIYPVGDESRMKS